MEDSTDLHILCANSEGKTTLASLACIWEGDIKTTVKTGYEDVNWFQLVQKRVHWLTVVKTVKNLGDL